MKIRDVIRIIERDGWFLVESSSSANLGITLPHSEQTAASSRLAVPQFGQKIVVFHYLFFLLYHPIN